MPSPDEGLDQPLQPVARHGRVVELVQRADEGRHRLLRIDPHPDQMLVQAQVMPELRDGHRTECCLVGQRRRQPAVAGEPLERGHLAVRECAEQVDDGLPFGRQRPVSVGRNRLVVVV